jgi:hypothetical protein
MTPPAPCRRCYLTLKVGMLVSSIVDRFHFCIGGTCIMAQVYYSYKFNLTLLPETQGRLAGFINH